MATQIFNIWENMEAWDDVMGQMIAFVNDTNADVDMAYDWVCEMMDISSFVDNNIAWDSFYNTWESCENRNDLTTYIVPCWCCLKATQSSQMLTQTNMKDIRIKVTTGDGLCTIWYERTKTKCSTIQERVYNQLCGLNIKEIEVSPIS